MSQKRPDDTADADDILPDAAAIKDRIDLPAGISFQFTPKQLEWCEVIDDASI